MPELWKTLGRRTIANARVFTVEEVRTVAPRTGTAHDFYVIRAGDWVNVVAVTEARELVCVRQFRHGVERVTLEIPGGIIDPGETPVEAARRELAEETGYTAHAFTHAGAVDSNPAILTNRTHTVVAHGVRHAGAQALDGTEDIEVVLVPLADLPGLVRTGAFSHALAVAALYVAGLHGSAGPNDART